MPPLAQPSAVTLCDLTPDRGADTNPHDATLRDTSDRPAHGIGGLRPGWPMQRVTNARAHAP